MPAWAGLFKISYNSEAEPFMPREIVGQELIINDDALTEVYWVIKKRRIIYDKNFNLRKQRF